MPRRRRPLSVTGLASAGSPARLLPLVAVLLILAHAAQPGADAGSGSERRSAAAVARRQPDEPAALSLAGRPYAAGGSGASRRTNSPRPRASARRRSTAAPSGFGAGDTGFDSSNRAETQDGWRADAARPRPLNLRRRLETTFDQSPVPTPPQVPPKPPVLAGLRLRRRSIRRKAAARPGAILPPPPGPTAGEQSAARSASASRPRTGLAPSCRSRRRRTLSASASTPPPDAATPNTLPLGTVPQRPLPLVGRDPYAALGIRAGSFLILPALEMSGGYDNNPQHVPGGPGSAYYVVAPELHVRSDWSTSFAHRRHHRLLYPVQQWQLYALAQPSLSQRQDRRPDRRDAARRRSFSKAASSFRPIIPAAPISRPASAKLPIDTDGRRHVRRRSRNSTGSKLSLKGTFDRTVYRNSELTDGEAASNDDRAYNQYGGILRVGYAIDPGLKPFVEGIEDARIHDTEIDRTGAKRDSNGTSIVRRRRFRCVRHADRRNGCRISPAHLHRSDVAEYQRCDRRRRADLAGHRPDDGEAHLGVNGRRVGFEGGFRRRSAATSTSRSTTPSGSGSSARCRPVTVWTIMSAWGAPTTAISPPSASLTN